MTVHARPDAVGAPAVPVGGRVAAPRLLGLGTALPQFHGTEADALMFVNRLLDADIAAARSGAAGNGAEAAARSLESARALVQRVYTRSGIETRHSVIGDFLQDDPAEFRFFPPTWTLEPQPGTAARMAAFEREAVPLAEQAARRALDEAAIEGHQVTHLVISTCTGFFAPGPDVLLARRLGLPSTVARTVLGFMGCYAGVSGMRAAGQIAMADPRAVVLQVSVELCTLHFRKDWTPGTVVASALFTDGAAAAVWTGAGHDATGGNGSGRTGRELGRLLACHSHVSPDSLDHMSWRIGDTGFLMRLDAAVPDVLRAEAPGFVSALLAAAGLPPGSVAGWAIHPGGRRIVEAVAGALGLSDSDVESSTGVLRDCGNMSSATILFVLDRELRRADRPPGPVAAMAFGPGLTVEGAVLERLR